jgi:hypothetical protein
LDEFYVNALRTVTVPVFAYMIAELAAWFKEQQNEYLKLVDETRDYAIQIKEREETRAELLEALKTAYKTAQEQRLKQAIELYGPMIDAADTDNDGIPLHKREEFAMNGGYNADGERSDYPIFDDDTLLDYTDAHPPVEYY